ncbi:nucleoside recognition domain-containing protein [Paenibacillus pasadenensis]|uniref:nucleoside recognition domain-containing protein n=1 Tax=Paenibacillus pasadenensis TaxID=217090 RepID=UPI00203E424E|nr:nucleoside recognition domain-containing protein [Paenibacillus pasadenensis]MCM3746052.1 nucleoside recognition domain-containing protein [Paenibacillus pasadenensis]
MLRSLFTACAAILIVVAIVSGTSEAFQASLAGLSLWWNFVFPAVLPFLVLAELTLAFGLADGIGVLLSPLMRLLRLPGTAGWALVQGWTSGYPAGAAAAGKLVASGRLSRSEGQRLLALCHSPNPLFVIVVLGAGFLHQPMFGLLLLPIIWLGSILAGLLISRLSERFGKPVHIHPITNTSTTQENANSEKKAAVSSVSDLPVNVNPGEDQVEKNICGNDSKASLLSRTLQAIEDGRNRDGRAFGKALGDGVASAVQQLMAVGGLIILASVLLRLCQPLLPAMLRGPGLTALTEAHLGAAALASWHAPDPSNLLQAAALAAALGWGGLCALLQAGGAASGTGLKLLPLACSRLLAGALAGCLALLLWQPLQALSAAAAPAFTVDGAALEPPWRAAAAALLQEPGAWAAVLHGSLLLQIPLMAALLAALLLLSAAAAIVIRIRSRRLIARR